MSMTPEQIERNRVFIRDLRANEKKTKGKMQDSDGGRCCLCVAYDTAQELGADLPEHDGNLPPSELADFYGWSNTSTVAHNPRLTFKGHESLASFWNDGSYGSDTVELTHAQIADAFEETFPEIKQP